MQRPRRTFHCQVNCCLPSIFAPKVFLIHCLFCHAWEACVELILLSSNPFSFVRSRIRSMHFRWYSFHYHHISNFEVVQSNQKHISDHIYSSLWNLFSNISNKLESHPYTGTCNFLVYYQHKCKRCIYIVQLNGHCFDTFLISIIISEFPWWHAVFQIIWRSSGSNDNRKP